MAQAFESLQSSMYIQKSLDETEPDFVNLDKSRYECRICGKLLLREPMQTECGHRMHRVCIEERLNQSEDVEEDGGKWFMCPVQEEDCVRVSSDTINPDFSVLREINQQEVYCTYKERGCGETVVLRRLKVHTASCEWRPMECQYRSMGCVEDVSAKDLEEHQRKCGYKPTECKYCSKKIPTVQLQDHIGRACPSMVVDCPQGCGVTGIKRSMLDDHLSKCPSVCKFYTMGCKEKGNAEHMKQHENKDTSKHMELVMLRMAELKLENAKLRTAFDSVSDELDKARVLLSERNEEIENLKRQLSHWELQLSKHKSAVETQLKEFKDRTVAFESKLQAVETLSKDVGQLKQTQAQLDNKLKDLSSTGRSVASTTSGIPGVEAQFREHGAALQDHTLQLDKIALRLQCAESTSFDGTLIWKISEFTRRMKEAVDQKFTSLYSQPFYTDRFGYKLCARLYPNGDGVGRGTHVSLFFVIMKGEFDNVLPWPFRHRVTLMLLNQKDLKTHVADTFRPDLASSSFQKPISARNVASGCPLFVSHERIRTDDSFVRDDAIFVKIIVDKSEYVGT